MELSRGSCRSIENEACAFSKSRSDVSRSIRRFSAGTCILVPGRGGPRIPTIGFASRKDSSTAQPRADNTRNRPETIDTVAPLSRQLAMTARTVIGRSEVTQNSEIASAHSALAFDRAEIHVEGRPVVR